jgi:hypothetical protein
MANRFKELPKKEKVEKKIQEIEAKKPTPKKNKSGLVKSLTALFSGTFLSNDKTIKNLPFILFLGALALFYIANGYWADDKIRQMNKISSQIKELRSEFITSKSDLMFISKQSEVAKAVEKIGLKEPVTPPKKIVTNDSL